MKKKPTELISSNRLDVFTKTALARALISKQNLIWPRNVYLEYLRRIEPKGGFSEDQRKFSLKDYEKNFEQLVESVTERGFDKNISKIPMGTLGITNGAHRLAVCLALGTNPEILESGESDHIYDYRFMKSVGFDDDFLDFTVLEYLKYSSRVKVICLMGISNTQSNEILSEVHGMASVIFAKEIFLSRIGGRRIVKTLYGDNSWWEEELLENLYLERFSDHNSLITCIFVDEEDIDKVVEVKNRIRLKYANSIYSKKIHSTDNSYETIKLGQAVLSKSSIHFLNNAPIGSESRIIEMVDEFFDRHSFFHKDKIVFDSGTILEMYGIRESSDIDYITIEEQEIPKDFQIKFDCHNSEYRKFPIAISELVNNPSCFFYCNGYKFMDLSVVSLFKSLRSEIKDHEDLRKILELNKNNSIYATVKQQGKAIKHRRRLIVRAFVDSILGYFPNWLAKVIREIYKQVRRQIFTILKIRKNYL